MEEHMKEELSPCKDLYYLVTIADEGSLTKAAEKLYLSQPSLSFFLKELERKIGVQIFTRAKTGLLPTAAGEKVLSAARAMLDEWARTLDHVHSISSTKPFIFATPAFRGTIILPSIMVDLNTALPELNFKFEEMLTHNVPQAFESGRINAAFMVNDKMSGDAYSNRKIIDEEIFLVSSSEHAMYADAKSVSTGLYIEPEMLCDYNVIVLQPHHQLQMQIDSFFKKNNITPKKIIETSNIVTSIKMAESGIGVTFLPTMFLPQCDCAPVSIGRSGLYWPIYLSSRKKSSVRLDRTLFTSIQETYKSIMPERISCGMPLFDEAEC